MLKSLTDKTPSQRQMYILAALGSGIEYYDFCIFIFFTKILGNLFFSVHDPLISTLLGYSILIIGTFGRLFGGILFSHIGDKHGRKSAFLYTILCMTIPSFIITFLPTYASIGIFSTILLIFLRLLQGFAVGGEIPGAATLIYENVNSKNKSLACSVLMAGNLLGLFFASFVQYLLSLFLSNGELNSFGWRIAFFVGGLLGIIGIFIRKKIRESPVFLNLKNNHKLERRPILALFKNHFRETILATFLNSFILCFGLIFFSFLPSYLSVHFHYNMSTVLKANSYALIICVISIILCGFLTKKFDKHGMFKLGCFIFLVILFPIFLFFSSGNTTFLFLGYFFGALFSGLVLSPAYSIINEMFPAQVRFSGFAISLGIAAIIFGSGGASLCTYVIQKTNFTLFPAVFMMICCSLSFISIVLYTTRFRVLVTQYNISNQNG